MRASKKTKVLILDGGGSSLKVFVQTDAGLKLEAKYEGDFNMQTGNRQRIRRTISTALKRFPTERVKIGLAGIISKEDKNWLVNLFAGKKVCIMSDVDLAFELHFQNRSGMMAILGTGSIFIAKAGRKKIKLGGYGRVIGDVGSGYAIGQEAVRNYLRLLDGFEHDEIFEANMKKFFRTKQQAIRKIYQEQFELQKLAPVVLECAVKGSRIANKIIDHQVSLVVQYIEQLRQRIGCQLPLCMVGGLLHQDSQYARRLKEQLSYLEVSIKQDFSEVPS